VQDDEKDTGQLTGSLVGRQVWRYVGESGASSADDSFDPHINPNAADKPLRRQLLARSKAKDQPEEREEGATVSCLRKGLSFYERLQCDDGHFAGDYGGPHFLIPGLVIACYITGHDLGEHVKRGLCVYLRNHQQIDGGWGTHIEGASTMFGTVLSYVSLRLLGTDKEHKSCRLARAFIHAHGGAVRSPLWCRFWLCVLGVYEWDGLMPIPPELWGLPRWFPFHPGNVWVHARLVKLPMSYLYGKRYSKDAANDTLVLSLRTELYTCPYERVDWAKARQTPSADIDCYVEVAVPMKVLISLLSVYERVVPHVGALRKFRSACMRFAMEYVHHEDAFSYYICIGPVNKTLNMLCCFAENPKSDEYWKHIPRLADYLWLAEDGIKMQGECGSQLWDTAFACQAALSTPIHSDYTPMLRKIQAFVNNSQVCHDVPTTKYFRHNCKGGWPFTVGDQNWPVSDCTAEGIKCSIALAQVDALKDGSLPYERMCDGIDYILSLQNRDGGWATYEPTRGSPLYELLNPCESFGDIMIDYSYTECTSACVTALGAFSRVRPEYRGSDIERAIRRGRDFILAQQMEDGSWYGSWGVCFTYASWFAIEGLRACGVAPSHTAIQKCVHMILSKQRADGGWYESFESCTTWKYDQGPVRESASRQSNVIQSSWALLALLEAECPDKEALNLAAQYIMSRQTSDGDWPQENIVGVFNRSVGITYTAYRNVFPIWALGKYAQHTKHSPST